MCWYVCSKTCNFHGKISWNKWTNKFSTKWRWWGRLYQQTIHKVIHRIPVCEESQNEILKNRLIIRKEMNLLMKKLLVQFVRKIQMPKQKILWWIKFNSPLFTCRQISRVGIGVTMCRTATHNSSTQLNLIKGWRNIAANTTQKQTTITTCF